MQRQGRSPRAVEVAVVGRQAGCSGAVTRRARLNAGLRFCRPGQPNLVLETGEVRGALFHGRQVFIQKLR